MKKYILILLLLSLATSALDITDFIQDDADVLSLAEEQELRSILKGLYDKELAEYAIVTIPRLEGKDITSYAWELAEGTLGDSQKNNGLLLLVALEDRKYRFEVGRGLEPLLPDGKIGRIGRTYLVPAFREEQFGAGIINASKAIHAVLSEDTNSSYYVKEAAPSISLKWWMILILLLALFIIPPFFGRHRSGDDYFIAAMMASSMSRGRGLGGFGGFGGGSFGGGGAGGGW